MNCEVEIGQGFYAPLTNYLLAQDNVNLLAYTGQSLCLTSVPSCLLFISSVGGLSPTAFKFQNDRRLQGATLQKFLAVSNCHRPQGATLQGFWSFQTTVAHRGQRYKVLVFSNDRRPQGATLQKFSAVSNSRCLQGATLPSIHGMVDAGRGTGSGNRQIGRSADGQMDNRQVVKLVASGLVSDGS